MKEEKRHSGAKGGVETAEARAVMAQEVYDIRRSGAIGHAERAKNEANGALIS